MPITRSQSAGADNAAQFEVAETSATSGSGEADTALRQEARMKRLEDLLLQQATARETQIPTPPAPVEVVAPRVSSPALDASRRHQRDTSGRGHRGTTGASICSGGGFPRDGVRTRGNDGSSIRRAVATFRLKQVFVGSFSPGGPMRRRKILETDLSIVTRNRRPLITGSRIGGRSGSRVVWVEPSGVRRGRPIASDDEQSERDKRWGVSIPKQLSFFLCLSAYSIDI
uniref:Uncharacterized protein n=1 Tax=Ananas comosus var. bracteatus TaxID=296719 RepID=A0A6V7P9H3_ANACO|nr:unnamed protein product [Ananas comosus var. bracteatus]